MPAGGCGKQGRNEIRFTSAEEESARNVFPISTPDTPHMPPIRTIGTTPLGLFMSLAFTRGSASAAQPRASWQNPVGIPGGGWGNMRPSDSRRENGDRPTLGVSGWGNWSAPIYAHPIHVHSRFPAPNAKGVVPYSPGLRRQRRYPGYGDDDPTNHKVVVPFVPAGGCGKQGRNEIVFAGAEEESARNVCPISTTYTHITYHPFEPSAQPRWGC